MKNLRIEYFKLSMGLFSLTFFIFIPENKNVSNK